MKLSIIIPAYNEEKTIKQLLEKVKGVKLEGIEKEIIVIDDGSKDKTAKIAEETEGIKLIKHEKNSGKGTAIRTGIKNATGDILLIQDADLEYNPEEYSTIITPITEGKTKAVYGSRFTKSHKPRYYIYYIGNKILTTITNLLYGSKITDMETCYKAFTKEVAQKLKLKAKRFEIEPEITAKILKNGYKITEVPISYTSRRIEEGKKIGWKDGMQALYYLIKYKFAD